MIAIMRSHDFTGSDWTVTVELSLNRARNPWAFSILLIQFARLKGLAAGDQAWNQPVRDPYDSHDVSGQLKIIPKSSRLRWLFPTKSNFWRIQSVFDFQTLSGDFSNWRRSRADWRPLKVPLHFLRRDNIARKSHEIRIITALHHDESVSP
jgi:hypothetical protein